MEREQILALAKNCGAVLDGGNWKLNAEFDTSDLEAFYHAARKPLEEENQSLRMALADTEALEIGTSERCEQLRQQLAEKDAEIESLIGKNQNLFNALMASTQKKDNLYQSIRSASGHLNLYGLFSCVEGDSYDPECADKNVRKANSILRAELTMEVINPAGKEDQAVCNSILKEQYK